MDPIVFLGAGNLAREAFDWAVAAGAPVSGYFAEFTQASNLRGKPVFTDPAKVPTDARWVVAVGDPKLAFRLAGLLDNEPHAAIVHPSATRGTGVRIGAGSLIGPGCALTCDIAVGRAVTVNPGCILTHDCVVEDYAALAPGVALAGKSHIGRGVMMGIRSSTLPGISVAAFSVVGAGAVVTESLPAGTLMGIPARHIKPVPAGASF